MDLYEVVTKEDKMLRKRSQEVPSITPNVVRMLDRMAETLGEDRAAKHHAHFSKIEYSKGGEVKHLTFEDTEYGPEFSHLAEELVHRGWNPRIICESAGTQAEDALEMKRIYQAARG